MKEKRETENTSRKRDGEKPKAMKREGRERDVAAKLHKREKCSKKKKKFPLSKSTEYIEIFLCYSFIDLGIIIIVDGWY